MLINATEFKNKVGKYLDIVSKEEVIISRNGKQIAKLVPIDKPSTPNVDAFLELLKKSKKDESGMDLKAVRKERLGKYEGTT